MLNAVIYVALKYSAYSFWMYIGLKLLANRFDIRRALWFGFLRLMMGVCFGVGIFITSNIVAAVIRATGSSSEIAAYLSVYVPVRWFEWGIMSLTLQRGLSLFAVVFGNDAAGRKWRLGGVAISCLADLVLFSELGGLPIGRFLC